MRSADPGLSVSGSISTLDTFDERHPRWAIEDQRRTLAGFLRVADANQVLAKNRDLHTLAIRGTPGTLVPERMRQLRERGPRPIRAYVTMAIQNRGNRCRRSTII